MPGQHWREIGRACIVAGRNCLQGIVQERLPELSLEQRGDCSRQARAIARAATVSTLYQSRSSFIVGGLFLVPLLTLTLLLALEFLLYLLWWLGHSRWSRRVLWRDSLLLNTGDDASRGRQIGTRWDF